MGFYEAGSWQGGCSMLRTSSRDGGFDFHTREFEKYPKSERFAKILVIYASGSIYMLDILEHLYNMCVYFKFYKMFP